MGTPLTCYQFHLSSEESFPKPDAPLAISPGVPESQPPTVKCIISH